jgi:hypothetical protein
MSDEKGQPGYGSPYRRPQIRHTDHAAEIEEILGLMAGTVAAMKLGEPAHVVELWNNRMWEALRRLTPEQRIEIIVILAAPPVGVRVNTLLAEVRRWTT